MVERVTSRPTQRNPATLGLTELRDQLMISKEALDDCLMEQPDLYYHVAEGYALAVSKRDAAKLDMEQVTAELGEQFRNAAATAEEKITEAALTRKITLTPRMKEKELTLLHLREQVDQWQALKEAYQQRSYMLKELVQMLVARLHNVSLDRSVDTARGELGEARRQQLGELRQSRGTFRREG